MQQVTHNLQHNAGCLHLHNLLHMAADIHTLLLHVLVTLLVSWLLSKATFNPKSARIMAAISSSSQSQNICVP